MKGGKIGQIEFVVEDQTRLDAAVGQEQAALELGQARSVFRHNLRLLDLLIGAAAWGSPTITLALTAVRLWHFFGSRGTGLSMSLLGEAAVPMWWSVRPL